MINTEHYRQIAAAAEATGVSYDTLAARYERGMPIEQVIGSPDAVWINLEQAANIMGTTYGTLTAAKLTDQCLATKSASKKKGASCRGAGRLILRADAMEIARIKREVGVSLQCALKIMRAIKENKL